jgi:hypothetical protein
MAWSKRSDRSPVFYGLFNGNLTIEIRCRQFHLLLLLILASISLPFQAQKRKVTVGSQQISMYTYASISTTGMHIFSMGEK